MSDQTIKADAGKPRLSLVPTEIINQIARVREYGINKYPNGGPNNWKKVELDRYRDAAYRHLLAYIADPKGIDEESGLPHLAHLACNVAFLCELEALQKEGPKTDKVSEEKHKNEVSLDNISEETRNNFNGIEEQTQMTHNISKLIEFDIGGNHYKLDLIRQRKK